MNRAEYKAEQRKKRQAKRLLEAGAESAVFKIMRAAISDGGDHQDPFRPPYCKACKSYHTPEAGHGDKT